MKSENSQNFVLEQILRNLKHKEKYSLVCFSLRNHSIDENLRSKMIDWMIEVTTKFDLSSKTYFLSVKILDKFLQNSQKKFTNNELLIIGVACMFIASKYEDVKNYNISVFVSQIGHDKFSVENLKILEVEILMALNFNVDMTLSIDFLMLICETFEVPLIVRTSAENILIIFQLYYNLQLLPSLEAACALIIASEIEGFNLNLNAAYLLYNFPDLCQKVNYLNQILVSHNEVMKKYKNVYLYRNFEILTHENRFFFKY